MSLGWLTASPLLFMTVPTVRMLEPAAKPNVRLHCMYKRGVCMCVCECMCVHVGVCMCLVFGN